MFVGHRRNHRGQGLIGLLLVVIIVALLWHKGILTLPVSPQGGRQLPPGAIIPVTNPQRPPARPGQPAPVAQQPRTLQGQAGINVFKATAEEVKKAVSQFQLLKGGVPRDLAELHLETGIDLRKDPWGGQYYVHQGWLKCTGNTQLAEKVW